MLDKNIFNTVTADWFDNALGLPTEIQNAAWPAIAEGFDTLVSAPTGTGKTLSSFLVFLDRMTKAAREGKLEKGLQLIYISPLKSLAADIRENLTRPLEGIYSMTPESESRITVGIRTGDTPQKQRQQMLKNPPHILITTPESLYLMLTSKLAKNLLKSARAIIIDELHSLIDSKRGAHLMLSIARLDKLCGTPLQRIGVSATIEPLDVAAKYLSPDKVVIAAPKTVKQVRIQVNSPYDDKKEDSGDSSWMSIAQAVYDECKGMRSVIAFTEGRATVEKLTYFVNQIAGLGFAHTHHGSLPKEHRQQVENALREGKLRLLCATSSLELGIDIGSIDKVLQIGCPRTVSSAMQRLGRAGHKPGEVSVMHIIPKTTTEAFYCGLTAEVARNGGVEHCNPQKLCLDVLAQHLVSMATAEEGYTVEEVLPILHRAYPFDELTADDVRDVLVMLSGDYEHGRDIPVRPRLLYDRIHDRVDGDPYSRMLAVSGVGTIPDRGMFSVKTEQGVKIGDIEEELAFELKMGEKFLLGTFAWRVVAIQKDTVVVKQASVQDARIPFWKSDYRGSGLRTGMQFGKICRHLNSLSESEDKDAIDLALHELGMDMQTARQTADFLKRQILSTTQLPDDKTIIIEHFHDSQHDHQMMVHSLFGQQVNEPLALLMLETAKRVSGRNIGCSTDTYGFLLHAYDGHELPEKLLQQVEIDTAEQLLESMLPSTGLFNILFRYNAGTALMFGVKRNVRQPLWVQRLRSAEMLDSVLKFPRHPIVRETKRECLHNFWDIKGLIFLLEQIRDGQINVLEVENNFPSPMSLPIQWQVEANNMYEYTPTPQSVHVQVQNSLDHLQTIKPETAQLEQVSARQKQPKTEMELHSLLMIEGEIVAGEVDAPIEWLEDLSKKEKAMYVEPGLWIPAEKQEEYSDDASRPAILRRMLRYKGAKSAAQISERFCWDTSAVEEVLDTLCESGEVIESEGLYYHAEQYKRAQRETIQAHRRQVKTAPPESYAALLASSVENVGPKEKALENALKSLTNLPLPMALWESVILPARVSNYSGRLLDGIIASGEICWRIENGELSFHNYDDIDWENAPNCGESALNEEEKIIYTTLLTRGASFTRSLSGFQITPVHIPLLSLVEKGLVSSDSFLPARQVIDKEKLEKSVTKVRAGARAAALSTGRWTVARQIMLQTDEQLIEQEFDRHQILCRETLSGIAWPTALEKLRVWEYTGRVRRGYFVEGLSGAQFVRSQDFHRIVNRLEKYAEEEKIVWLNAVDPMQAWGKTLNHLPDRSFICVAGTAVALWCGTPVAVLERQGKQLRVFDYEHLGQALSALSVAFGQQRIFPKLSSITIKQYPDEAAEFLTASDFSRQMMDFVLYRR